MVRNILVRLLKVKFILQTDKTNNETDTTDYKLLQGESQMGVVSLTTLRTQRRCSMKVTSLSSLLCPLTSDLG